MLNDETTPHLIEMAKKGDLGSLECLLKNTEKDVYSLLYYLSNSEDEISDMVQEILLKVVKNIKNLKSADHYKGWLNKIITRYYFDCMRKKDKKIKKTEFVNEEIDILFQDTKHTPVNDCIGQELIDAIKNSVQKLAEPYKFAIIMREFKGLSYEDIAKLANVNIGTVKSRISRARSQLKEDMQPYME